MAPSISILSMTSPAPAVSARRGSPVAPVAFAFDGSTHFPTLRAARRLTLRAVASDAEDEWGKELVDQGGAAASVAEAPAEAPAASEVADLKVKLKEALYGTERGMRASSDTRAEVIELITQLEARNPTPAPTEALTLLNGKWILAYTSFSQLFPLLGARSLPQLVKVEEISQTFDSENFAVQNCIKFSGPLATTSVSTNAKFEIRSPKRVQIKFDEGVIGTPQLTDSIVLPEKFEFLGQNIDLTPLKGIFSSIENAASSVARTISGQPPLKIPIKTDNAESWLLTTYLDDELRISRSDGSSIFVLFKEGSILLY
ncbi:hypothetical protein GUJ93_ZPchr0002g25980 [Zizania palustris]|uniref:Plastid lipid-associated protein/fibrillin conserved domain-containing protein n=1 Tax=Zizania palustris TaxID=103762 RepID=A0A8J5S0G0_ZIZPA|nr:hypothetical protein GUJ93_ZPchr0002g25980 [Zizania palustris]